MPFPRLKQPKKRKTHLPVSNRRPPASPSIIPSAAPSIRTLTLARRQRCRRSRAVARPRERPGGRQLHQPGPGGIPVNGADGRGLKPGATARAKARGYTCPPEVVLGRSESLTRAVGAGWFRSADIPRERERSQTVARPRQRPVGRQLHKLAQSSTTPAHADPAPGRASTKRWSVSGPLGLVSTPGRAPTCLPAHSRPHRPPNLSSIPRRPGRGSCPLGVHARNAVRGRLATRVLSPRPLFGPIRR